MPTTSLISAHLDGRAQNPRFIQKQLRRLHRALQENADVLQAAAVADDHATEQEALLEFLLSLEAVRRRFLELDQRAMLQDEYRVANGLDWQSRRIPVGIVVIRPQTASMLYSTVAPLVSAIAAGNCAMIEIQDSLHQTPQALRNVLNSALDQDVFSIVDRIPADPALTQRCLIVDQTYDQNSLDCAKVLHAPSERTPVVAIVDRSADIAAAAQDILASRIACSGRSVYAPDVVLVNEFAMDEFLHAAVQSLTQRLSGSHRVDERQLKAIRPRRSERSAALQEDERSDPDTKVILEGDNGMLAKVGNRKLAVLAKKISGPNLVVHPVSSLDDAIDFASSLETPLLAAYHYAALPAAKYTSQFINASASFINHIPVELQVGPAAPAEWPVSPCDRYRPEMFSRPAPQFVTASELTERLLWSGNSRDERMNRGNILKELQAVSLPADDQRDGKVVGFFDQGLITGASVRMTPIVGGLVAAGWYGVRAGMRWLRT